MVLRELLRRGLIGGGALVAACSCPDQKVIRSPASLAGMTIPIQPSAAECEQLCGPRVTKCERIPVSATPVEAGRFAQALEYTVLCSVPRYCPGGRRPAGLEDTQLAAGGLGAHFAELARIEAASVTAFEELAVELALHGAPPALVEAAHRAAREEVDHALRTAGLAARYGSAASPAVVAPTPPRSLGEILVENAVEGLVHERYGAALAAVRAERAHDPHVRAAMSAIARDEASHAALASAIHVWGSSRIARAARRGVEEVRERALADLGAVLDVEPSAPLAVLTGMPSATLAVDVLATLSPQPSGSSTASQPLLAPA